MFRVAASSLPLAEFMDFMPRAALPDPRPKPPRLLLPVACAASPGPQGPRALRGRKPRSPSRASRTTAVSRVTAVHSCGGSETIQKADSRGEGRSCRLGSLGGPPTEPRGAGQMESTHHCLHGTSWLGGDGAHTAQL